MKEDLAIENENIENCKIDEQHKFSLNAEFVWILQKSGRRRSTVLRYVKCAYSERNDINTEQLEKNKKINEKNQPTPGVDRGTLEWQRCTVPLSYVNIGCRTSRKINILISINYKTSDNSVGSSLYEDFLLVNFLVL